MRKNYFQEGVTSGWLNLIEILKLYMQAISFIAEHKEQIKKLMLDIENLIPATPGNSKAVITRNFISTDLNVEA